MKESNLRFKSVDEAVSILRAEAMPMSLSRFDVDPAKSVILAVNATLPGDHPDARRDRSQNADIEMAYLYRVLIERGHVRQVFSGHHHFLELNVTRVVIDGDLAVYGFVKTRPIYAASRCGAHA